MGRLVFFFEEEVKANFSFEFIGKTQNCSIHNMNLIIHCIKIMEVSQRSCYTKAQEAENEKTSK